MSNSEPQITAKDLAQRWWQYVTAFLLVVVEILWMLPWYFAAMQPNYHTPFLAAGLVLGGIMLVAYGLTVVADELNLLKNMKIALLGAWLVAGFLLARSLLLREPLTNEWIEAHDMNPGFFITLLAVLFAWWRGIDLARQGIYPRLAWLRLEVGMLMLAVFVFFSKQLGGITPGVGWFSLFLFTGFLAVVFARITYVSLERGETHNPFDWRWLGSTAGLLAAIVLVAGVLSSLLTGQYSILLVALAKMMQLMVGVTLALLSIPGLIVIWLLTPLRPDYSALPTPTPTPTPEPMPLQADNGIPLAGLYKLPDWPLLRELLPAILLWTLVLALVIFLVHRLRNARLDRRRHVPIGGPESLLERGEAGQLLRQAFVDAFNNLARRFRPVQRALVAARIRQIYAEMMDLCAELGCPRPEGQTPLEFLPEMSETFPGCADDLALITQAYIQIRYGELPETPEDVQQVEAAWQKVAARGLSIKRAALVGAQSTPS